MRYLLAIDQGTTGTTVLVMDLEGRILGRNHCEFPQHYPQPGWVEHDPEEIFRTVRVCVEGALASAGLHGKSIAAAGITNQRETTVLWDRKTGEPAHRAIVWQDRRTASRCEELRSKGHEPTIREKTGLVLDPYFSGTKLEWLLDNVPGTRERAERGELAFGTVDSYLVWRLSGGEVHATDVTNASRTLLMNLHTLSWDADLLALFRVPARVLPEIVPSAKVIAHTKGMNVLPDGIPIAGIAGDQQAALFGQACFGEGDSKCTYGTGAFILVNTGRRPRQSRFGLLTTVAWQIGDEVVYALEGSAFTAGAAVQWLRDGLGIIKKSAEVEELARKVDSSEGVSFVPALAGLGAPYWDPHARGILTGLTRGTTAAHIARATLEGIAFQVDDLLRSMADDLGLPIARMRADGGASANNLLMQLQADISDLTIERPQDPESTAKGAAMLAGLGAGLFREKEQAARMSQATSVFRGKLQPSVRDDLRQQWADAVRRARSAPAGQA